ncbi:hydantoinase/oxoprolinase family protein [Lentibacillus amyloliquefaciens]|uniref:Methylhydantoinase n=1 Tax=Lentibacillus amyloliquefaciens TaxID=1472767 RepID=A0A0U4F923_9BACI|nr:hydantoinase/oxoprolinase family protein [Lentibacillus amyloliquefaciens]ALX50102.1 methylhydantoinase [Lentibacillus amyloliquefaciens]
MVRVGVDVGGTFTDLILVDESANQINVHKVPSTTHDQSVGVIKGVKELCAISDVAVEDIDDILHGTTVATNITIEGNGAKVGMLTTRNYRDILHIARHKKSENFSIQQSLPWQDNPLVKRRHRLPITEKLQAPDGRIRFPMEEQEVRDNVKKLKAENVDVIIVGFLFSFLNDVHEKRAKEIVNEIWPEVTCFTSSEVAPRIREYERFSTTAMNAFVAPKVNQYIDNLVSSLEEANVQGKLQIMQSSGGMASSEKATMTPMNLLKSGPAGGVLAASWWGELDGIDDVISVDIGGTSADISIIPEKTPRVVNPRDAEVNSYPVITPMLEVDTIGAGGGSIAYVDAGGAFRVGPKSAGSTPGPACYGQGGEDPCVTDANVALGRLDPEQFLGGEIPLHPEKSTEAIQKLADELSMTVEEAAFGILKIINNNMALSIRENSVRKGIDPRNFALLAAGGAGPLHSIDLAETIGSKTVMVPNYPGITASAGLLISDLKYHFNASCIEKLETISEDLVFKLDKQLKELEGQAAGQLMQDGVSEGDIEYERIAECRYMGQGFELRVPIPEGTLTEQSVKEIISGFHLMHQQEYGHHFPENDVELISLDIVATGKTPSFKLPQLEKMERSNPTEAFMYERQTYFEVDGEIKSLATPRYQREKLSANDRITGPASIIQRDSTTIVPPNWEVVVSAHGTLHATQNEEKADKSHNTEKQFTEAVMSDE